MNKKTLSRYKIRTKDNYTNALHEMMQSTTEVLPFRQRLQDLTNTVCCATLTYGYEDMVFQTTRQSAAVRIDQTIRQSTAVRIGKSVWLKANIFITAGQRPAEIERIDKPCLKGRIS
jgi:hypothetical protein